MAYDNTNTGALFKNERKDTEKFPDYRGTININGVDYDLAGWVKTAKKSGKPFLSLKVSEPRQRSESSEPQPEENPFL